MDNGDSATPLGLVIIFSLQGSFLGILSGRDTHLFYQRPGSLENSEIFSIFDLKAEGACYQRVLISDAVENRESMSTNGKESSEVLRIKIRDTEAAGIEIVPTHEGVEIIVTRKPAKAGGSEEPKGRPTNAEILKEFCKDQKSVPGTDIKDLRRFYDFYLEKVEEWRGTMRPEDLYKKWQKTKKQ